MIILKHLTVDRFRLLREVNLHFPQRGSILIQGPNEAGKSALLESIYFVLYGEPLSSERKKHWLDDLILYGANNAIVTLTCAIGATEMTITRTIERGKGQAISLSLSKLGQAEEGPITHLTVANERILKELGQMDGEALRNSCFIEQKGLARLEQLRGIEREATVRKLLGLEHLTRTTAHFKITPYDERLLEEATERLRLAEIQARIPEQRKRLEQVEAALDAVTLDEELVEVAQQQTELAEQETAITQLEARRRELKNRQGRIQQLKKADATLAEIIAAYEAIAEAKRELPNIEKQIAELDHREQEELPVQEKRVRELAELMKMFGTLQRMSSDLLSAVEAIKVLEHDEDYYEELQQELRGLTEQVAHAQKRVLEAQERVTQAQRSQDAQVQRRRNSRPLLEERLERMKALAERLGVLRQIENQYRQHLALRETVADNERLLRKAQQDVRDTEQELELVESEAKQTQQEADTLERRWRQLSIRRQLEEWQRLKGLSQGLADAEQHVRIAHQQQERFTLAALEARSVARKHLLVSGICGVIFVLCAIVAFVEVRNMAVVAIIAIIFALASAGVAGVSFQSYGKARKEESLADQQMQKAMNTVSMMVAARESALRMNGNQETLIQIEHEIQALGGTIPRSLDDVARMIQQMPDTGESLTDMQKQIQAKRDAANAARNQVNVTMEAVANLRKERLQLDERRVQEGWDDLDMTLRNDQIALERMQQEIVVLAGQEGLPQSSINVRVPVSSTTISSSGLLAGPDLPDESDAGVPPLESLVESTIQATERELAMLTNTPAATLVINQSGKTADTLDSVNTHVAIRELQTQVQTQQDALDILIGRRRVLEERLANYAKNSPTQQLEQMREQQNGLRTGLQTLQDSLRQRVKVLGLLFGQTAVNSAEMAARKQLEELHILLGSKVTLEAKKVQYQASLKEHQASLAELYKQLAKYSNTLGSWVVPANPFAETLATLRNRCQHELQEANEQGTAQELEKLQQQEGALQAKIALCRQDIEGAQERIDALLQRHKLSRPTHYKRVDVIAVWPLLATYSIKDRFRLEQEQDKLTRALAQLEEQASTLQEQLHLGDSVLDLEQARARKEQQERSYETKKRGNQLVKAVNERLMKKIVPRTEHYMQQVLPLLTSGRYHDVHVKTELEEGAVSGGPFQLSVWDGAAGDYISPSTLSGGAADQLSLALRLAFAIAVLPRELGLAPGFMLLDEPLSHFDRSRTQALVDVVTGDVLSQHFEQVLLVSQSNAFDQTMFPYHISMENGMVIESNLPIVQTPSSPSRTEPFSLLQEEDEDNEMDATIVVAAVTARLP